MDQQIYFGALLLLQAAMLVYSVYLINGSVRGARHDIGKKAAADSP